MLEKYKVEIKLKGLGVLEELSKNTKTNPTLFYALAMILTMVEEQESLLKETDLEMGYNIIHNIPIPDLEEKIQQGNSIFVTHRDVTLFENYCNVKKAKEEINRLKEESAILKEKIKQADLRGIPSMPNNKKEFKK